MAYVLVAVSAYVQRCPLRGAVVVKQLVAHGRRASHLCHPIDLARPVVNRRADR